MVLGLACVNHAPQGVDHVAGEIHPHVVIEVRIALVRPEKVLRRYERQQRISGDLCDVHAIGLGRCVAGCPPCQQATGGFGCRQRGVVRGVGCQQEAGIVAFLFVGQANLGVVDEAGFGVEAEAAAVLHPALSRFQHHVRQAPVDDDLAGAVGGGDTFDDHRDPHVAFGVCLRVPQRVMSGATTGAGPGCCESTRMMSWPKPAERRLPCRPVKELGSSGETAAWSSTMRGVASGREPL